MAQKKRGLALPKVKELRAKNVDELKELLAQNSDELMRSRFRHATAALEDTAMLRALKRQIARIQTILNEKNMGS